MRSSRSSRKPRRGAQQELFRRGGKRRGAGRKPRGARAGERHEGRPACKAYHPLHVVMRVAPEVGSLRRREMYKAIREATITAALRERFRIVHVSLQRTHVHFLVAADHKAALARVMQGFTISAARNINSVLGEGVRRRRGRATLSGTCWATGGSMERTAMARRGRGSSIRSPRGSCSRTGRSCRT